MWDDLPALMDALSLPRDLAATFPAREETVRSGDAGDKKGPSADTRKRLKDIYKPLRDKIRGMDAVYVV